MIKAKQYKAKCEAKAKAKSGMNTYNYIPNICIHIHIKREQMNADNNRTIDYYHIPSQQSIKFSHLSPNRLKKSN